MKLLLYLLLILFVLNNSYAIVINEILYNPEGSDNNKEFIEIYSENWTNLSDYIIEDLMSSDKLELIKFYNNSFSLIVEEGFNYTNINATIYSVGAAIGNNLNNDYEVLILRDNNSNIIDVVSYFGNDKEGFSIERVDVNGFSSDDSNWKVSSNIGGTPGIPNSITTEASSCDYSLDIITNGSFLEDLDFKIKVFKIKGKETNLTLHRSIEDFNGNIVKIYDELNLNLVNQRTISLTPNLEKGNPYLIKSFISNISCGDGNVSNNFAEKLIYVKNNDNNLSENVSQSYVKIFDYDDEVNFGDKLKVEVNVYKGDTSKRSIELNLKNNENNLITNKFNIKDKFTNTTITFYLDLPENCDNKFKEGKYELILEGLDDEDSENVNLKNNCSKSKEKKVFEYNISLADNVFAGDNVVSKAVITNNYNESKKIKIWSYFYSGRKSLSGDRESNMRIINLGSGSSSEVLLNNTLDIVEEGNYKFKIKFEVEGRKTPYEFTKDVLVLNNLKSDINISEENDKNFKYPEITGNVVYDNSIKNNVYWLFIGALILLVIYLIRRKNV